MLRKLTELGIRSFRPLACERSVVTVRHEDHVFARWQAICVDAVRQSKQAYIPVLLQPASVSDLLGSPTDHTRIVARGGDGSVPPIAKVTATRSKEPIDVWVGPEGGFSETELAAAVAAGVLPARLGHTTLRTETAAVAAVAAVIACCDGPS